MTGEQFTLTTWQVRESFVYDRNARTYSPSMEQERRYREAGNAAGEFDRWLAAHDAEVRASVQPPTREQIVEAMYDAEGHPRVEWSALPAATRDVYLEYADAVLALFPQPAPSAELGQYAQVAGRTVCVVCWRFDGEHEDMPTIGHVGTPPAEPMGIADMAPGTRLVGRTRDGVLSTIDRTWIVTDDHHVFSTGAHLLVADRIDPSTIRDVTPPAAT